MSKQLRLRAFKTTTDDWYPSYQLKDTTKLIEVSCLYLSNGKTRVCAWGADDDGMELDYDWADDALETYLNILSWDVVTHADLTELGFGRA